MPYALASGLFAPDSPEAAGVLKYMLRHGSRLVGLVRAGAYALYEKPVYPVSGTDQVYGTNVARFLADGDAADQLVLSLYGSLAVAMTPNTFVSGEAASVAPLRGSHFRSMYLPPNGASNAAFLQTLRALLVHETRDAEGAPTGLELALRDAAPVAAGGTADQRSPRTDELRAGLVLAGGAQRHDPRDRGDAGPAGAEDAEAPRPAAARPARRVGDGERGAARAPGGRDARRDARPQRAHRTAGGDRPLRQPPPDLVAGRDRGAAAEHPLHRPRRPREQRAGRAPVLVRAGRQPAAAAGDLAARARAERALELDPVGQPARPRLVRRDQPGCARQARRPATRGAPRGRSPISRGCPRSCARRCRGCGSTAAGSTPSAAAWAARRRCCSWPGIRTCSPASAAFSSVTDLALQYKNFDRVRCKNACRVLLGSEPGLQPAQDRAPRDRRRAGAASGRATPRAARSRTRARSPPRACRCSSGGASPTRSSSTSRASRGSSSGSCAGSTRRRTWRRSSASGSTRPRCAPAPASRSPSPASGCSRRRRPGRTSATSARPWRARARGAEMRLQHVGITVRPEEIDLHGRSTATRSSCPSCTRPSERSSTASGGRVSSSCT